MRSDALQRRRTILRVARQLFAESGRDVSLECIAETSGVGVATFYRNFSSREDLIHAVAQSVITDVNEATDRLERDGSSTEQLWREFVQQATACHLGALSEIMSAFKMPMMTDALIAKQQQLMQRLDRVIGTLKDAELLRSEVTAISFIASLAIITRPQTAGIRDHVPEVQGQLIEAYLLWSLHAQFAR